MAIGVEQIAEALSSMGLPAKQCADLAVHLDRRAHQLAAARKKTHEEAVNHLIRLMAASGAWSDGDPESKDPDP